MENANIIKQITIRAISPLKSLVLLLNVKDLT